MIKKHKIRTLLKHFHDHMVDLESGDVVEFVNHEIEALQHKIAEENGFELVDHSLVLYVKKKKVQS